RYVIPTTDASTHTRFCHLRTDYFAGHPPDERDRVRRDALLMAPRSGSPPPDEPATLPVPTEQRLGLDDQQRLAPAPHPAREQEKQRPVGARQTGSLGRAGEDDELLPSVRVLGDELGPGAHQVRGRAEDQ